ncbi:MAG TPA: hypothetical protein DCG69_12160 [Bacteroidales bacterium]|nr:hypothetical protein [Bacteroidales bacterium]
MAKVVIGIHGLGNKPSKDLLEKWWKDSIMEGFELAGIVPASAYRFELVYWADIIYFYPEHPNIIDTNDPYFLKEPYRKASKEIRKIPDNHFRKKVLQFIENQLEKLFLNEDMSLNYAQVSDILMHKYFKELAIYYGKSEEQIKLKMEIRNRLRQTIEQYKYDEIFLIGHSMGSMIAYDVLNFDLVDQQIHTFATIGSALGIPQIRAKIAQESMLKYNHLKINTPESVSHAWLNFSDLEDKIALNFDLNNDFAPNSKGIQVSDFEIINDYSFNGIKNPHKAYGYLRNGEFIRKLNAFLSEKEKHSMT